MIRTFALLGCLLLAACGTSPASRFCVDAAGCDPGQSCSNNTCVEPADDASDSEPEDDSDIGDANTDSAIGPDASDADASDTSDEPDTLDADTTPTCTPPEIGLLPNDFTEGLVSQLNLTAGESFTAVARNADGSPVRLLDGSAWFLDGFSPLAFDATLQNPLTFAPEVGEWRLLLEWATSESCRGRSEPMSITVNAPRVPTTIRVTLRWSPEPAGTTTDLDLHMTRVVGTTATWSDANDCYFRNTAPDWGAAGNANDPLFSGDDRGTPGVEVITVTNAADDAYLVGINLYRDIGPPGADATVTIETPTITYTDTRTLSRTGEVWYPVAIRRYAPESYELVELNTVSAGFTGIALP